MMEFGEGTRFGIWETAWFARSLPGLRRLKRKPGPSSTMDLQRSASSGLRRDADSFPSWDARPRGQASTNRRHQTTNGKNGSLPSFPSESRAACRASSRAREVATKYPIARCPATSNSEGTTGGSYDGKRTSHGGARKEGDEVRWPVVVGRCSREPSSWSHANDAAIGSSNSLQTGESGARTEARPPKRAKATAPHASSL